MSRDGESETTGRTRGWLYYQATNVLTWTVWSMWTTDASLRLQWWKIVSIIHGSSRNWNSGAQYTKSHYSCSTISKKKKKKVCGDWLNRVENKTNSWVKKTVWTVVRLFLPQEHFFCPPLSSIYDVHNNLSYLWNCKRVVHNHCVWHWTPWLRGPSSSSS